MDYKKIIREEWFNDHVATITQHGDLRVMEWRKPGTGTYYCRYVFDGFKMYITGDIGDAVFRLTWKADVHSFNDVYIGYFHSKIAALRDDKYDFVSEKAVARLREWLKDLKEYGKKYDNGQMKELFDSVRECQSRSEWAFIINQNYDFISSLDQDFFEWMYLCGDEIPIRVHAYLIGLQMASEQLKNKVLSGE